MDEKRIRIPDEDVELTTDEIRITQTRQFQRLFNLKQLGLAHLVYPAATHTRGVHSIQCLHEATKIMDALPGISDDDRRNVRIAALLHDIGHIPFSHTLEDEHSIFSKHDRPKRLHTALDLMKKELGVDSHESRLIDEATPILMSISGNDEDKDWRSDVIGNTVCADLLAYITTDATWTGISKRHGAYRIYEYFNKENNRVCIKLTKKGGLRTDIVSAIMDLLDMRYALTERVFFHHAKCIASAMLARAVRMCEISDEIPFTNSDQEPYLYQMGDERFLYELEKYANQKVPDALPLIDGIRSRHLYKRIYKISRKSRDTWDDKASRKFCNIWRTGVDVEEMLQKIERLHDIPYGSLVLWCPEEKSGTKLVRALVNWEAGENSHRGPMELRCPEVKAQFPLVGKRIETMEDQYYDLWSFWIGLHRDYIGKAPAIIKSIEHEIDVPCDAAFLETYLQQIPELKDKFRLADEIDNTMHEIMPKIQQEMMYQQASLSGDTKGDQIDESVVLATTLEITERELKKKSRQKNKNQADLFGSKDPLDENLKEKNKQV